MEAFATVEDLEARWRLLDDVEGGRAAVLLEDAAAYLTKQLESSGVPIDGSDVQEANLRAVSCNMVRRMLGVDDELFGITQYSKTAGSFTTSGTAANPNGDMYLTSSEKTLLGIAPRGKRQRATFVRVAIHDPNGGMADAW